MIFKDISGLKKLFSLEDLKAFLSFGKVDLSEQFELSSKLLYNLMSVGTNQEKEYVTEKKFRDFLLKFFINGKVIFSLPDSELHQESVTKDERLVFNELKLHEPLLDSKKD